MYKTEFEQLLVAKERTIKKLRSQLDSLTAQFVKSAEDQKQRLSDLQKRHDKELQKQAAQVRGLEKKLEDLTKPKTTSKTKKDE